MRKSFDYFLTFSSDFVHPSVEMVERLTAVVQQKLEPHPLLSGCRISHTRACIGPVAYQGIGFSCVCGSDR